MSLNYLDILVKLRKVTRSVNLESKRIEKEFGISIPQLLTLRYLADQTDCKDHAKNIKSYLNLNASTVSGILTRLESKALITRSKDLQDKRASFVILTAKGLRLLQHSPQTLQEKLSKKLQSLTPEQIVELDRNIELLTNLLDAENIDAAPLVSTSEIPKY